MKTSSCLLLTTALLLLATACKSAMRPDQVAIGVAGTLTALPSPIPLTIQSPAPTVTPKSKAMPEMPGTAKPSAAPSELNSLAPQAMGNAPYPSAPLCADTGEVHDNSLFHTLWDSTRGCHYDHEHGQDPFSPEVAATFPGFDLQALIGDVGVGHTNPSSPMENTHKHGGFKWDVVLSHPTGCEGKEGAPTGVDAFVIQLHGFGNYAIEFEARIHSAVGLMRQCRTDNPVDYGYIFVNQFQDYGQRTSPYQGVILQYPDTPQPVYRAGLKPYFTVECIGGIPPCDKYPTRQSYLDRGRTESTWISEPDNLDGSGSPLFGLSFGVRDTYQVLDLRDQEYPFTFVWMCSSDGGLTYNPVACHFNNSTTQVVEFAGTIPTAWDNLAGFDTDPRVGRITADDYVTRFGDLNSACSVPGPDCHPIKMVEAFVGRYGSFIISEKFGTPNTPYFPERDIYFCGGLLCTEGAPGAAPSGWIGPTN